MKEPSDLIHSLRFLCLKHKVSEEFKEELDAFFKKNFQPLQGRIMINSSALDHLRNKSKSEIPKFIEHEYRVFAQTIGDSLVKSFPPEVDSDYIHEVHKFRCWVFHPNFKESE